MGQTTQAFHAHHRAGIHPLYNPWLIVFPLMDYLFGTLYWERPNRHHPPRAH